jgi:hypothetical protein
MSGEEKTRVSGEVSRSGGAPVLPTVNPQAEKSQSASGGVHPAVYVAIWIACSSSVILFNKWLLDTLNFRTFSMLPIRLHIASRAPREKQMAKQ